MSSRNPWDEIASHLHVSSRSIRRRSLPNGAAQLRLGCWLSLPSDFADRSRIQRRLFSHRARLLSFARQHADAHFTLHSALALHAIPTWRACPEVNIRRQHSFCSHPFNALTDPLIQLAECRTRIERTSSLLEPLTLAAPFPATARVDSLEDTAIICAARLHPLEGFVAVCAILRRLCSFDRFALEESRQREEAARARLLSLLAEKPLRNFARAHAIISLADAAAESVGERALLWALLTVSPVRPETQCRWELEGSVYFTDFFLAGERTVLEFDGATKMGDNDIDFANSRREQMERQLRLERAGLRVLRYQWRDFDSFDHLRALLCQHLSIGSTRLPSEHRRLWVPEPPRSFS
ncbi:hypothetical protein [Buchananella felis]|uniref:hypothetical protein n=1 Tax=Buchananella felis TaxID=3231492 RepID=UPI0035282503